MPDDILARLHAMPSSLNDALRTMEDAAIYIEDLERGRLSVLESWDKQHQRVRELERMSEVDALYAMQLSRSMSINATLHSRIGVLEAALQFIADDYGNQDINHVDYRVKIYQVARAALDKEIET